MIFSPPPSPLPSPQRIQAFVVRHTALPGGFFQLRLGVPGLSENILPGSFIQLQCHPHLVVPRPFSIHAVDPERETLDLLYRVVGRGTEWMSRWEEGEMTWLLAPLGRPFSMISPPRSALLIAGGVGLPPLAFLARRLVEKGVRVVLFWGIETDCPFPTRAVEEGDGRRTVVHLEAVSIYNRLASLAPREGFFQGYVTDLASDHLQELDAAQRARTVIYTCGPPAMITAAARVAERFNLVGQASLEAHMACGFGGCAGCVVPINDHNGEWHYKRVCVDGPVFPLDRV